MYEHAGAIMPCSEFVLLELEYASGPLGAAEENAI